MFWRKLVDEFAQFRQRNIKFFTFLLPITIMVQTLWRNVLLTLQLFMSKAIHSKFRQLPNQIPTTKVIQFSDNHINIK